MSDLIKWDEKFSVGIPEIDQQHQKLFQIIDAVFDGFTAGGEKEKKALAEAFDKVLDYTRYHFATEERYFEEFHYPDAEEHKKQHARLLRETLAMKKQYTEDPSSTITFELVDFLTLWLQKHILLHDKKYAPFVRPKII